MIFGVLSAFGFGASDFVTAIVSRKLGILRTAVGVSVVGIGVTTAYMVPAASFSDVDAGNWAALTGVAVLGSATLLCFYRALQLGPVAIVTPVVAAHAMVVILLAVAFAGERLSAGQAVASAATVGGVVIASVDLKGLGFGKRVMGKGVLLGLGAMLGIGLWQYSIGVVSQDIGWFLPIYISRLLTFAILAPASVVCGQWPWQRLTRHLIVGVALIGVLETGALFAFTRGAEVGVISIVAAASTSYPIVPVLGGLLVFRERIALSQGAGLAIALAGLLVLAMSS